MCSANYVQRPHDLTPAASRIAKQRAVLDFVLSQYIAENETKLGGTTDIRNTFLNFRRQLYDATKDNVGHRS